MIGRRFVLPAAVAAALEQVFEQPVNRVTVIERSAYAKLHCGMRATTRPDRILLAMSGAQFVANPELLLHEYYHVLCQWRTGYLTRWRYVLECMRHGYRDNRYEQEARKFTAAAVSRYRACLEADSGHHSMARRGP
ncbi:MAG: hypothetical protein NVS1B6_11540 [Steroidobacteraceae bacterium]